MSEKKLLKFSIGLAVAGLIGFLVYYALPILKKAEDITIRIRGEIYSGLSSTGNFISEIKKTKNLIEDNIKLKEENLRLTSSLAIQQQIEERNNFLESALNLGNFPEKNIYDAGTFNARSSPEGSFLLVNKGEREGITKDDVVISSSGVLIGTVHKVFPKYSEISSIVNQDFRATIKVMSKDIVGIANGALEDGLYLDFISQEDDIAEGDIIITSGNDLFPPGLVVGKVILVTSEDGSLFKNVRVDPAFKHLDISRVLVIGL